MLHDAPRPSPRRSRVLSRCALALVLALGLAPITPALADEAAFSPVGERTIHPEPPPWLAARFEAAVEMARRGETGPRATPEAVRGFLYETWEHIREVNTLVTALGGRARPIPQASPGDGLLKGIHDFGEATSTRRVREALERWRAEPLVDRRTGEKVPVPAWIERMVVEAERAGRRSIDIGKLNPHVAAGLGRAGPPDPYSIALHNLSPHHAGLAELKNGRLPGSQIEALADKVNAMRQVRVYRTKPIAFEDIRGILAEEVSRSSLSESSKRGWLKYIDKALRIQRGLERRGKVNPYNKFEPTLMEKLLPRQRDGTIDWKTFRQTRTIELGRQAGGLAHFTLALFLKELAVVVKTGDRGRIEEFFEGLATTDFFVHYGMFAASAQLADVTFGRYLSRTIRPRFVAGLLRTNVVLAAGLALPELVRGRFDGKVFAIDLASLGLSSVAVRSAMQSLGWVTRLETVAKAGARLGRFAKAGGWFYTVAETAVVLYLADEASKMIHDALDERGRRDAVEAATGALFDAIAEGGDVDAALEEFRAAHESWRERQLAPAGELERRFQRDLESAAEEARRRHETRAELVRRLEQLPALKARAIAEHGSVEAFVAAREEAKDKALQAQVEEAGARLEEGRLALLQQLATEGRRDGDYLETEGRDWLARGAQAGGAGDPFAGRTDLPARRSRRSLREDWLEGARRVSENRPQSFADQLAVLRLARRVAKNDAQRTSLDSELAQLQELARLDAAMLTPATETSSQGLGKELEQLERARETQGAGR